MVVIKLLSSLILLSSLVISSVHADESPREILEAAIKAYGGVGNLAKTLTGSLLAKGTMSLGPVDASISWEEAFELPRRYRRKIEGEFMGRRFTMEYAITEGSGWIRQDGGKPKPWTGKTQPSSENWNGVESIVRPPERHTTTTAATTTAFAATR